MKIGIDIDDTALITVEGMVKYGDIFCREILNKPDTKNNVEDIKDRFYLQALYGWDKETKFKFFDYYYKKVLEECLPKEDSPLVITKLKEEGNEIYFISARLNNIDNCNSEKITKESFQKYNIPYDKIIVAAYSKLEYCKENNIDVFIDDSFEVLDELSKEGIKCFLMTTPMNKGVELPSNIIRVHTWNEIYDYLKEV